MTKPLFDPNKCDIPEIPSLTFDFVSDCSVQPPPPPIFDCPLPRVPRTPPPPPCPEFSAQVQITAGYNTCAEQSTSAAIIVTKIDEDPCRFFVDLDLNIKLPPPNCPIFLVGDTEMVVEYADCLPTGERGVGVLITKEPVYCGTSDSSSASNGSLSGLPESGICLFTMDMALGIPIPRVPCPEISVGNFAVNVDWVDQIVDGNALTITRVEPDKKCLKDEGPDAPQTPCRFTIDLDLNIPIPRPICPEITATIEVTGITATEQPTGTLTVTPQPSCKFDIELDLKVPRPCVPTFWCSERYRKAGDPVNESPRDCSFIEMLPPEQEAYVHWTFTKSPNPFTPPPHDCDYEIGLDIGVPCPDITATLDITAITATEEPTGTLTVYPVELENVTGVCAFDVELALQLPRSCVPRFWCSETFRSTGEFGDMTKPPEKCSKILRLPSNQDAYVDLTFEKNPNEFYFPPPNDCDYEVGLIVGLPVTGITVVTDITCVSGEIIVTKETLDIVLAPPA